jgi:hypothetical protein
MYSYEAKVDGEVIKGRIEHNRPDGLVTLGRLILEDIERQS